MPVTGKLYMSTIELEHRVDLITCEYITAIEYISLTKIYRCAENAIPRNYVVLLVG